ncbi:hypothetical protein BST61_g4973 [Cercospora zeina]
MVPASNDQPKKNISSPQLSKYNPTWPARPVMSSSTSLRSSFRPSQSSSRNLAEPIWSSTLHFASWAGFQASFTRGG